MSEEAFDILFNSSSTYLDNTSTSLESNNLNIHSNNAYIDAIYWKVDLNDLELIEAIDKKEIESKQLTVKNSTGHLLFQVVSHAQIIIKSFSITAKTLFLNDNLTDYLFVGLWSSSNFHLGLANQITYQNIVLGLLCSIGSFLINVPIMIASAAAVVYTGPKAIVKKIRASKPVVPAA